MGKPSAPYYYKNDSDTYHWEKTCHLNNYPDNGWNMTNNVPNGREQCNTCKSK